MARSFDVCGSSALAEIESLLEARGYRRTYGRPREPGEYYAMHSDAAPGWSDWMYEVELLELPDQPLDEVLAEYRAREQARRG